MSFFFLLISSGVDLSLTCPSLREGVWLFSLYSLSLTSSVPLFHPPPFSFFSQFFLITPPFSRWGYTFPLPPYLSLNKFYIRYHFIFYITIIYIYITILNPLQFINLYYLYIHYTLNTIPTLLFNIFISYILINNFSLRKICYLI